MAFQTALLGGVALTAPPVKSTVKLWPQAPGPEQKYRDRKRVRQADGSYREFVGYGPTKRAATAALYRALRIDEAEQKAAADLTVTQVTAMLLRHKRSVEGRKKETIFNDLDLYRRHVAPHIGDTPISEVTLADLEGIQLRLTEAKKYRTAELVRVLLASIYKYALRHYRADIRAGRLNLYDLTEDLDPVQRPAEARKKQAEAWSVDQLAAFLEAAKADDDRDVSSLLYPVFHTAMAAGLRRGELLGLRRQSLEVRDGAAMLHVTQQLVYYQGKHHLETPKTDAGTRSVPIGPELLAVLEAHIAKLDRVAQINPNWGATDLLFPSYNGRPLAPGNLDRAKKRLIEALGLPPATLHEMRGIHAAYVTRELVRQGRYSPKLVMQLLGQSHPNVALQHYNRVVAEDLAAATFDPILGESVDNLVDNRGEEKDATSLEVAS